MHSGTISKSIWAEAGVEKEAFMGDSAIPVYRGSFWTAGQRRANSLHEISYRACFKPALPEFFIKRFSDPGDVVYDPFSGRGTTVIEAALQGRRVISNDVNPLSAMLTRPRMAIPDLSSVEAKLASIPWHRKPSEEPDLGMFYEEKTLREILNLRKYLHDASQRGDIDSADNWIRMVATNRLSGHSPGFFSVYTLPPNQAVSRERQIIINRTRRQLPQYRDVKMRIWKKSLQLLKDVDESTIHRLRAVAKDAHFLSVSASETSEIPDASVHLTITSPPFLNVVQYAKDNWLRCWFNHIDAETVGRNITMASGIPAWTEAMQKVFMELFRITRPGGHVAFEVGEVHKKQTRLEEYVVPLGLQAGFGCECILLNEQAFTKTANIWGVSNNAAGTNSNRIVLFRKG